MADEVVLLEVKRRNDFRLSFALPCPAVDGAPEAGNWAALSGGAVINNGKTKALVHRFDPPLITPNPEGGVDVSFRATLSHTGAWPVGTHDVDVRLWTTDGLWGPYSFLETWKIEVGEGGMGQFIPNLPGV